MPFLGAESYRINKKKRACELLEGRSLNLPVFWNGQGPNGPLCSAPASFKPPAFCVERVHNTTKGRSPRSLILPSPLPFTPRTASRRQRPPVQPAPYRRHSPHLIPGLDVTFSCCQAEAVI
ncbi:unnamed protein product [Bursaphelenchus xylophilus]|uniref:(pine wood nematode) hypothetical protein n=1 Tax=Bursaphelenchus xylophilus TaxID=6326 RepID=A0A1I7RR10_BURXY|nr:unnamed protein product [Bursaphelenchus xylophilus]CAG9130790.1 unnamed protein product [Bursaphelenchus xylophilus]